MSETSPKPFVFVLMPFDSEFDDTYKLGIKSACEDAGAYAERVDEQKYDERILDRIYNQIAKADLIIADMTGRNPNVFYETGYAHAIDKRVILVTKNADDIPFDLIHHHHIVYEGKITKLKEELYTRVKWALENPRKNISNLGLELQFVINDIRILNNPVIEFKRPDRKASFSFIVNVHNPIEKEIKRKSFQMALITPEIFQDVRMSGSNVHTAKIDGVSTSNEEDYIHVFDIDYDILPGSWLTGIHIYTIPEHMPSEDSEYQLTLRIFSTGPPADYHFRIKLIKQR